MQTISWFKTNKEEIGMHSLNKLYKVAQISKQAVHQYQKRETVFDKKLYELVLQVDLLRKVHPGCGVEKMYQSLQPNFIGRDAFIEIMMDLGYRVKRTKNYIKTTLSASYKYPNLIEGGIISDINQIWQSDITYFLLGDKFYYIVFILDVYSRRILGFIASDNMRAEANIKALNQSLKLRQANCLSNLIHHSDRGSQYISKPYTNILLKNKIKISMGLKATENAFVERINGTIKNEYLKRWKIKSFKELKSFLKIAVKHYNQKRPHNSLPNRMSPIQFEQTLEKKTIKPKQIIHSFNYDLMKQVTTKNDIFEQNIKGHYCNIALKHEIINN